MNNSQIEKIGIRIVEEFEREKGRIHQERVHKCGYDLRTTNTDGSDERHIEIKTTSKKKFNQRWLEELEQKRLETDDLFYVYLVTNCGKGNEEIKVLNKENLEPLFSRVVKHYYYDFGKVQEQEDRQTRPS